MPGHKVGLLFVNKTSSSKSLSNSKSDSLDLQNINKHVQKSRDFAKEREVRKQIRKVRLATLVGYTPVRVAPNPALIPLLKESESPTEEQEEQAIDRSYTLDASKLELNEDDKQCVTKRHPDYALRPFGITSMTPTQGSLEPFAQFRVPMNSEKHQILQYFVARFFPAVTRSTALMFMGHPPATTYDPAVYVVRRALSDELHVLSFLTAASTRMKYVDGHHFTREDLPERLADHALRLLRKYLASGRPITHELVQSIMYLWAFESYRREWAAVETHRKMIMVMADEYLGGFQNLDPYMRRMFWLADRFQAAATQTAPTIKDRWLAPELTERQRAGAADALAELGKQPIGWGFTTALPTLSDAFKPLLHSLVNLACIIHCHWEDVGFFEAGASASREWAIARSFYLADEFINFREVCADDQIPAESCEFQECLRLSLIIYLAFVPASTPYAKEARLQLLRAAVDTRALRRELGQTLSRCGQFADRTSENLVLLFWVAGLGAIASEVPDNQEWFAVHFQRLAKMLNCFTWEDFMPIQERFLVLDPLRPANKSKLTWLLQRAVYANPGG